MRSSARSEADEVLVRVHATTVTRTDVPHARRASVLLALNARTTATQAEDPRSRVRGRGGGRLVRDAVRGRRPRVRSAQRRARRVVCVREAGIAHIPDGMTFEQAAAVTDGMSPGARRFAATWVRTTRLVIYGASGSLGTAAVQLGSNFGAHVTAVCNTKNVELVRSLGADEVIDYEHEDFTRNGETYDVVLDAVGKHSFLRSAPRAGCPGGLYVATDRLYNFPSRSSRAELGGGSCSTFERPDREGGRPSSEGTARGRAGTGRSSTARTRSRTSSRRPATSRAGRRPATSSSR